MRKVLEILRLRFEARLSGRMIAVTVCAALSTVRGCLRCFAASSLAWPVDLDEAALDAHLYPRAALFATAAVLTATGLHQFQRHLPSAPA